MRASRMLLSLPLAGLLALAAPAQTGDSFARLLVDPPAAASGDRDGTAREILARVRAEPGHALAEAALRLLELQLGDLDDPHALADEIRALDRAALTAAGLSPMAGRQLGRLQGQLALAFAPAGELGADLYPDCLSRFLVLGPLPDVGDPLQQRAESPQFTDPRFDHAHAAAGLAGAQGEMAKWKPLVRSPLRSWVAADTVQDSPVGWTLLACAFDAPGGQGFLEVETGGSGSGGFGNRAARAYSLSLNGEPAIVVDPLGREEPALRAHAVVLRSGRNRVMLAMPPMDRTAFSVRVLDAEGRPFPGLAEAKPDDKLGAPLDVLPPAKSPPRSVDLLAAQATRDPDEEALLGVLLALDGRTSQGQEHLVAAQQAAPDRPGLQALLAQRTLGATYLPDSWRRSRARALAEQVLEQDPHWMSMALHVAGLVSDEDKETEAVAKLRELAEALPERSDPLLALSGVYRKLDMDAPAEEALRRALDRTPKRPDALRRLAQYVGQHGQHDEALELELAALRNGGASGRGLQTLAARQASMGRGLQALELLREAVARDDAPSLKYALADQLADLGRLQEADALLAALADSSPHWSDPVLLRAELAARRGDTEAERARLREALARSPGQRSVRERLAELGDADPAEALFAAQAVDLQAARRADPGADSADSVVKLVDHAVVWVFPDGSTERLTQDLYRVRDLQGCEELGEMRVGGEVLRIATIKPDGTEFTPVEVGGSWVMPNLKPGDCVVVVTRERSGAPSNGVLRCGAWYFASEDQPFRLSRYVIRVAGGLPVRMEGRQLEGAVTHEQHADGDGVVHVFEAVNRPRMLDQPHAPPRERWLPWVEFGMDEDVPRDLARLAVSVREPTLVTAEIREAADEVVDGVEGQEARARKLHDFVNQILDQRGWQGATAGLIGREGSGSWLYAALLDAAGVPYELVWSHAVSPEADPDPDPPFAETGFWSRKLFVLVQPADGEPAWCDMDAETLPYGQLMADAPGASAIALPSRRALRTPDAPLDDRPTFDFALDFTVAADGSAGAQVTAEPRGGLQWAYKEALRDAPAPVLKNWVESMFASVVNGLDLQEQELPGLKDPNRPLTISGKGRVPTFLDDDGRTLSCRLPVPPLELAARLASGEGRRSLPYFEPEASVQTSEARLTLDPALSADELPSDVLLDFGGGRYELSVAREAGNVLRIRRRLALPPLSFGPEQHVLLAAFCARVDEAESARLRLRRAPAAPAAVDQSGTGR